MSAFITWPDSQELPRRTSLVENVVQRSGCRDDGVEVYRTAQPAREKFSCESDEGAEEGELQGGGGAAAFAGEFEEDAGGEGAEGEQEHRRC